MPSWSQTWKTSSKIERRDRVRLGRGDPVEVLGDVVGRRLAAGLGDPPVAEADEDAGEAAGAGGEVVVGELAVATGEVHDDGDDELRLDGVEEPGFGLELVAVADGLEHHPRVAERQHAVGEDPVLGAFDGDDVGQTERARPWPRRSAPSSAGRTCPADEAMNTNRP